MSMYLYKAASSCVISAHTYMPESEKIKSRVVFVGGLWQWVQEQNSAPVFIFSKFTASCREWKEKSLLFLGSFLNTGICPSSYMIYET